jgi:hypothetical protein
VFVNLVPLGYILAAVLFWAIVFSVKGKSLSGKDFKNTIGASILVILFNLQSVVIQVNLKMFLCQNLYRNDTAMYFMRDYMDVRCWEGDHHGWIFGFALPLLILWVVILPVVAFSMLKKNKNKLHEEDTMATLGFLYIGYKDDAANWELVQMLRKYCLIIVGVFGRFFVPFLQIYLYVYIIWCFYIFHHKRDPYASYSLDNLERVAMICIGIVAFSGIYFDAPMKFTALKTIIIIIAIAANWVYYCVWAYQFYENYKGIDTHKNRSTAHLNVKPVAVSEPKDLGSPKETAPFKVKETVKADSPNNSGLASPQFDFAGHQAKFEASPQNLFEASPQNKEESLRYDFNQFASPKNDNSQLSKVIEVMDWNAQDTHKSDL